MPSRLLRISFVLLGVLCWTSMRTSHAADTCGLRPPAEDPHPADMNADGEVTTEEFVQYAAESGKEKESEKMDKDGDGTVTTEEFVEFAQGQAAGPVDLTAENFDEMTNGANAAFVEFMAPWCGHCQAMAPAWEELAVKVHTEHSGVRIGTVNCDEQKEFCELFQIQGFPTLLLMKDPSAFEDAAPVLYQKQRDAPAMLQFLHDEKVLAPAA